jgi:hypothetical protein
MSSRNLPVEKLLIPFDDTGMKNIGEGRENGFLSFRTVIVYLNEVELWLNPEDFYTHEENFFVHLENFRVYEEYFNEYEANF